MSNILSIQSAVAYGHVGNSAAVFPLQRIGHEVWPVYTVNFSNHTGYGAWGGSAIAATEVAAIVEAMAARGALDNCPKLRGFLQRIHARPAYQRALEQGGPYDLLS